MRTRNPARGGAAAAVSLKNPGDAISGGWTPEWDFPGNQKVTNGWSATYTQSGRHVSAKNPDFVANVNTTADATGGTAVRKVAQNSTAVWMDRIGAITAGRGLTGHLDEALRQASSGTPVVIRIVVHDLPHRDCAALASNGELQVSQNGLARCKAEHIDPIAAILANSKYRDLRIVEPDSLPNPVTNLDTSRNGWGGANRPSGASGSTADAYVDSGRIDRKLHRGDWCDQSGAGIATRTDGPNEEGKPHDPMCDPSYRGDQANRGNLTGAMADAPHAGSWFPAGFASLVQNAYPAL